MKLTPSLQMLKVREGLSTEQKVLFDYSYQFNGFQAVMFIGFALGGASEGVTDFWELLAEFKKLMEGERSH